MNTTHLLLDAGAIAGFAVLGSALMALGFLITDWLTPGKLADSIYQQRSQNAAILVASNLLSVGLIVFTAIRSSHDGFVDGMVSTAVYGLVGLLFLAVSFLLIDLATPGSLRRIVVDTTPHPAVWVSAAAHVATALMMCAAIA